MLVLSLPSILPSFVPRHDPRFGAAYVRYRRTVRGALAQLGVPEAERDDLAQEVFVVLLRQLPRLGDDDGDAGGLGAWMYQTARRVAANHRRTQRRRTRREDALGELAIGTGEIERGAIADAAVFLAGFFESLDDDARATFVLSEVEGRTGPEIAEQLDINVNTAYARVRSVRQRMQAALGDERQAAWLVLLPTALPRRGPWLASALAMVAVAAARISVRKLAIGAALLLLLTLPVAWMALGRAPTPEPPIAPVDVRDSADSRKPDGEPEVDDAAPLMIARGRIEGRVATIDGAAVASTRVCILPVRRTLVLTEPRCVEADSTGHYAFDGLGADLYALAATAPGHVEILEDISTQRTRLGSGQRRSGIDLLLRTGGARVRGTVVDATGGTIEGALVRGGDDVFTAAFARSDAAGRFDLWLDGENSFEVSARADGYSLGTTSLVWPGENDVEIALSPEATIEGRVVDDVTGDPVGGVAVLSRAPHGFLESVDDVPGAITDVSGRFVLRSLSPGRHHPTVRDGEWEGLAQRPVLLAIGETERDVIVRVHAARRLQGTAVMPDRSPCTGARVTVRDAVGEELGNTRADGDGTFELGGLPPERVRLAIACEHALPIDVDMDLAAASVTGETWEATPREGKLVHGRLLDGDGKPVALASVSLTRTEPLADGKDVDDHGRTDRDGRFELGPLPPGEYDTFIRTPDHARETTPERVHIDAADVDVELHARAESRLRVRTVDASATPIVGADVMYQHDDGGGFVTSGSDGIAIIAGAAGRYRIRAAAPGEAGKPVARSSFEDAVVVELGETPEVTLPVARRDGVVRGRVVDEDGAPVADTRIDIATSGVMKDWYGEAVRQRVADGRADEAGTFSIDGLEHGSYAITASTPGGVAGRAVVVATGESIVVVLPRTGSLCGTITLDGDVPPRRFEISVRSADDRLVRQRFVASDGRWCIEDLARGDATVEASTTAGTATTTAKVRPDGGTTEGVALRIGARGRAHGRIVDRAGAPIRGAYVFMHSRGGGLHSLGDRERNESGADGTFEMPGPAGEVDVVVLAPAGFETRKVEATLVSGERSELGDIVLDARE